MANSALPAIRVLRIVLLMVTGLAWVAPVAATAGPDYSVPARMALPWPCNESHRVTWDPEGHWTHYKATGIAFDFSMREGTPLFAPADGVAYFLHDDRPLDTNLGNYVEIVVANDWLIRLAHLRDRQTGERLVHAGELIGYSGNSGVPQEHLHLELLVRDGHRWVRPDLSRITTLFRLPISTLVEGNAILNDGCPAMLTLADNPSAEEDSIPLGDPITIQVPLRNDGLDALVLDKVQVTLSAPRGADTIVAEMVAGWPLSGKGEETVRLTAYPNMAGEWHIKSVWCQTDGATLSFPVEATFQVQSPPLKVLALSTPETLMVGERLAMEVELQNQGETDLPLDNLQLEGTRPDGGAWQASADEEGTLPAGGTWRFQLQSATLPSTVGTWKITRLGYQRDGQTLFFAQPQIEFRVVGPELVAEQVAMYPSNNGWSVFLTVRNVGTDKATPDAIEIWGWKPDGESYFSARQEHIAPLAPGASAFLRLDVPWPQTDKPGKLGEVGYWVGGNYYRIRGLEQPTPADLPELPE